MQATNTAFKTYACTYRYQGSEWAIVIAATSPEDARRRMEAMTFGRVEGEHVATLPDMPRGLVYMLVCIRNWLKAVLP